MSESFVMQRKAVTGFGSDFTQSAARMRYHPHTRVAEIRLLKMFIDSPNNVNPVHRTTMALSTYIR